MMDTNNTNEEFDIDEIDFDFIDCSKLSDETLLCECMCISVEDIRNELNLKPSSCPINLGKHLGMGTGCGSCLKNCSWKNRI